MHFYSKYANRPWSERSRLGEGIFCLRGACSLVASPVVKAANNLAGNLPCLAVGDAPKPYLSPNSMSTAGFVGAPNFPGLEESLVMSLR